MRAQHYSKHLGWAQWSVSLLVLARGCSITTGIQWLTWAHLGLTGLDSYIQSSSCWLVAGLLCTWSFTPQGGSLGFPTWQDRALTRGDKAARSLGAEAQKSHKSFLHFISQRSLKGFREGETGLWMGGTGQAHGNGCGYGRGSNNSRLSL